ncbi:PLP-dependent lyase/thiolase [Meridianimarinicoccus roseus]|uniref:PLP-dependent lyase/thiolase n=1 Tax=Meridianimarinicoccus roseus TaxID=2072018 RepID=A0A2V2LBP9_9RHOB|nr:pyridoxal-phosphate dependent enzyme [Meridianimarinicoccus roseus]PWR02715.1 PLP-dependent lyase/thiolase [Meridianimarinicoccus roseus]
MTQIIENPYRKTGFGSSSGQAAVLPETDAAAVARLLAECPAHAPTPLRDVPGLARRLGVARVSVKDESDRMGLGSFKALGAAFAIAHAAAARRNARPHIAWSEILRDQTYVTASAGNHGMSVAAGARVFGAQAVIFLSAPVPEAFAQRLRRMGAKVVRSGETYEDSMDAAEGHAVRAKAVLLSDSSWPGYTDLPGRVMQGYLQIAAEVVAQLDPPPTHILLQAGVGGLAAAMAVHLRAAWGDTPLVGVVEPVAAPGLMASVLAGHATMTSGPVSNMGRLDCKMPSMVALAGLARDADLFMTVTDVQAATAVDWLAREGLSTTPSGAAGLAGCVVHGADLGLDADARVLLVLSEGPEHG